MVVIPESPGRTGGGAKGEGRPYRVGFIDATGRMVIEPVYDDAKHFSEGLVVVGRNGKYGYVDPRGSVRIPLQFDRAQSFSEGLAQVRDAAGVRFIDQTGKTVIDMATAPSSRPSPPRRREERRRPAIAAGAGRFRVCCYRLATES